MDYLRTRIRGAAIGAAIASILGLTGCATPADPDNAPQLPADQQAFLDTCEPWDEWDKPAPPFRIYGNSYYVGTCGIAAILIKGDEGHVLIDSGTEAGAKWIMANVSKLGFGPSEVRALLHSHEHFDHVGGMARIQDQTGATVYASPDAALVLMTGKSDLRDPQFGLHDPMESVSSLSILAGENQAWDQSFDEASLKLGNLELLAIRTPGHTPGALTWHWRECDDAGECRHIVYADSLSPVSRDDYRFSDHPEYLEEYRASLMQIAELECDILITPHPSSSKMIERMKGDGLEGGLSCKKYAASIENRLERRLADEADGE